MRHLITNLGTKDLYVHEHGGNEPVRVKPGETVNADVLEIITQGHTKFSCEPAQSK